MYVLLIAGLTARALLNPVLEEEPSAAAPACRWSWRSLRCSTGCTLRGRCVPHPNRRSPPDPQAASSALTVATNELMKRRTVENCLAAADAYESAAATVQVLDEVAQLQLSAAEALVCALRIQTNGNILVLEGTQDSASNKRFWQEHGPRALGLVRASKLRLSSWRVAAAEMDAFLYANSAKGIVRQARIFARL